MVVDGVAVGALLPGDGEGGVALDLHGGRGLLGGPGLGGGVEAGGRGRGRDLGVGQVARAALGRGHAVLGEQGDDGLADGHGAVGGRVGHGRLVLVRHVVGGVGVLRVGALLVEREVNVDDVGGRVGRDGLALAHRALVDEVALGGGRLAGGVVGDGLLEGAGARHGLDGGVVVVVDGVAVAFRLPLGYKADVADGAVGVLLGTLKFKLLTEIDVARLPLSVDLGLRAGLDSPALELVSELRGVGDLDSAVVQELFDGIGVGVLVAVGAAVEVVRNVVGLVDQLELHDVGLVVGGEGGDLSGLAVLEVIAVVLRPLRAILADADHLGLGDGVVLSVVLRQHRTVHYILNGILDVAKLRVGERDFVLARGEFDGLHTEVGDEARELASELVLGKRRHLHGGAHLAAADDRIDNVRAVGGLVVDGVVDGGACLPNGVDGDVAGDRIVDVNQVCFTRDGIVVSDEARGPANKVVALLDGRSLHGLGA